MTPTVPDCRWGGSPLPVEVHAEAVLLCVGPRRSGPEIRALSPLVSQVSRRDRTGEINFHGIDMWLFEQLMPQNVDSFSRIF